MLSLNSEDLVHTENRGEVSGPFFSSTEKQVVFEELVSGKPRPILFPKRKEELSIKSEY